LNEDSGEFQDGSPLVAWKQSLESGVTFSHVFVNDTEAAFVSALKQRLERAGAPVIQSNHDVLHAARVAVEAVNPYGFHFAFLDPFDLGIPFEAIVTLLKLRRVDLLLHISAMDLQRNLPKARSDAGVKKKLDAFAPGWESVITVGAPAPRQREQLLQHWIGLVQSVGTEAATRWKLIRNSRNGSLYWLVLVARHELAHRFWNDLHEGDIQPPLF
jgi:three-Cys-motif partner protein